MKIIVEFESMEEFEAFRTSGKKTRGGNNKDGSDEAKTGAQAGSAPAPIQPPTGGQPGFNPGAFAAPGAGAAPQAGGFPAAAAPVVAPEVQALASRIVAVIDRSVAGGQNVEEMLKWFRGQCQQAGVDASNYTLDQIKQHALPKLSLPALEAMAKVMNA